jgi:cobalt-precorrin 5A hydrolase
MTLLLAMNIVKPDSAALFCLTPGGVALAKRLRQAMPITCYTSAALIEPGFEPFSGSFAATVAQAFNHFPALVFIGATGIAVRVIAPLLQDKLQDPAIVVIDERGQHVISLLSGHMGGANALSNYLAEVLGGRAVITTATDVNGLAALDNLAQQLDARMADFRPAVKQVNQMLVSGQRVGLWWDPLLEIDSQQYMTKGFIPVAQLDELPALDALVCVSYGDLLPDMGVPVVKLVPRRVVVGIGCRRNTPFARLHSLLLQLLADNHIDPLALRAIGSISLKQHEEALNQLAQHYAVPFELFSAAQLRCHEHRFAVSTFVRQTVGVGNVSQPVAWLMSHGKLVGETLREQGVTLTLGVVTAC